MAMTRHEWLRDLYRHQEWADAEHWRLIAGHAAAHDDEAICKRLHHIHLVQHGFLWMVGDRTAPFPFTRHTDFASFDALRAYARDYHSRVEPYFETLTEDRLNTVIDILWFKDPPLSISVAEALTQCMMHSQHHRAQNATRLRELGGTPENTDYIVWLWKGRPAPAW